MGILFTTKLIMNPLEKMESIQYNAAVVITGAIRGTSREKLYQELGLESLVRDDGIANSATF